MNIFFWFTAIFIAVLALSGIYQIFVEIDEILIWISEASKDMTFADVSIICLMGIFISATIGFMVDIWNELYN
tara:strand:+ start:19415 stop:19633 length:219 start_codon:yes stop_codon:yes gene_type:complete